MDPTTAAPEFDVAPRVTRGLRTATLRQRADTGAAGPSTSFDPETREFDFVLATSNPARTYRYFQRSTDSRPDWHVVDEVLDIAGVVDLDLLPGSAICDTHSYWSVHDQLGVIVSAEVTDEGLVCRGRLSRRADVDDVAMDIQDGVIRNVSVGYDPLEETPPVERAGQDPLVTITRWRPREASLCAVPVDNTARIRSSGDPRMSRKPASARRAEMPADDAAAMEAAKAAAQTALDAAKAAYEQAKAAVAEAQATLDALTGETTTSEPENTDGADAARSAMVAGLRAVAVRNGRAADFDAIAKTGASVAELRTIALRAIATSGEEVSGVVTPRPARSEVKLKTFHEYRALRAGKTA